jgi:RHS repeat-associated protein
MAGGEAEATIVTKVVKDLLGDAAEGVERDVARDGAEAIAKDAAEAGGRDAAEQAGEDAGRQAARDAAEAGEDTTKKVGDRSATRDPIDVASGEVLLHQVDVELFGVLPLALNRTHISSYRTGRWFGRSWASTLDQRLEVDEAGACLVGTEGLVLVYPVPMFGEPALPERGPRWPLSYGDDGYTVLDPQRGHTLHFTVQPNARIPGNPAMVLPLKAITDRNGDRIDLEYDGNGVLTEVRHSGGYRIGVETAVGRITALRLLSADDQPVLKRFGYDRAGRLTEVYNSSDRPTRFEYDSAGRMIRWTDTNDNWYAYTYDEQGRGVAGKGSGGCLNVTLAYHDRMTVVTDSLGHDTAYHLNEAGQVTAVVDPLGNTTWSEWDASGRLLSRIDPLGRITRCAYDEYGNLITLTRPDGARVAVAYNALGQPTSVLDPDGSRWRFTYDERGNVTAVTDPIGAVTAYTYDEHGHLSTVTDPMGTRTTAETDRAGLPIAVRDPLGATAHYARDAFGRLSAVADAAGDVTRFNWTIEGKLDRRVLPDGATESWSYDAEGNLIEYVDAGGQRSRYEVGDFDKRSAQTGPDGARTEFEYDTELRLTSVTNPQGLAWHYEFNPAGRTIRETDFDGRVLTYAYDAAGQLIERTNGAGQTNRYVWDVLGNVVEKISGDTRATFAYDLAGRLIAAANAAADVRLQRDPLGQVVAEISNGRVLASTYDLAGRRVHRRTPTGAESIWHYDPAGRPVALRTAGQVLEFRYDAVGREVQRRIGSATVLDQRWGPDRQLSSQTLWGAPHAPPSPPPPESGAASSAGQARLLQHRTYSYRIDGAINGIADRSSGVRRFDLDMTGRVTAVHGQGWSERYTYGRSGNLREVSCSDPAQVAGLDADAVGDREYVGTLIRRAGNVRYEYDAQGRIVMRQHRRPSSRPLTWKYEWDADDRLVAVITPDGRRWRYRYDPFGRRIAKQQLSADGRRVVEQIDFSWDDTVLAEQTHVLWRPEGAVGRTTTWEHEPGGFRLLTQTERVPLRDAPQQWVDDEFRAIVTDIVGTPTEMVDHAGFVVWQSRTTLWGSQLHGPPNRAYCPLRFPGQYHDPETGLNYNYHRYYDPGVARYGSNDVLGLRAGLDPHAYVSNPLHWIDPLGLTACRNFSSDDPYVADVANAIESKYPGHVIDVNDPLIGPDGKMITDLDVHTQNAVIQVKEGNARGIVGQMDRTVAGQGKPVIAYIPDARPGTVRALQRAGHLVTQDLGDLVSVVAP